MSIRVSDDADAERLEVFTGSDSEGRQYPSE